MIHLTPPSTLFPYTTLFRSLLQLPAKLARHGVPPHDIGDRLGRRGEGDHRRRGSESQKFKSWIHDKTNLIAAARTRLSRCAPRSEEHTSELQSQFHLVCRLL